jgi:peptidoglycan/xylan/chitin deacetylase (PgdA/CDA1 family)
MLRKFIIALVAVITAFCALLFWIYLDVIASIPVADKVVALTYDDGPNPPHTGALLKMLETHDVKATFFVKGRNIEAFPQGLHAVAQAGHEIGNHSYYHRPMIAIDEASMLEELVRTNQIIENLLGYSPVLFRPPYGAQGLGLKRAIQTLGMKSILMSVSGADWESTDPVMIANAVLDGVAPGSIILLHDGHGDIDDPAAQDSRAASVVATGIIIESLKSQGYRFATVGELLAMTGQ